jgi:hypothetical protein
VSGARAERADVNKCKVLLRAQQELIVRICFDPGTLRQSRSGSITGVVYFEFGPERQFPSPGWNDFVSAAAERVSAKK